MTGQTSKKPDVDLIVKNLTEIASLGKAFFDGIVQGADEIKRSTNVDSTWVDATDDVDDTPPATPTPPLVDPFDLYLAELHLRAVELEKDGLTIAAAAVRQIAKELREMDAGPEA